MLPAILHVDVPAQRDDTEPTAVPATWQAAPDDPLSRSYRDTKAQSRRSPLDPPVPALLHHTCFTCHEPWTRADQIAGGQDQIARDGLHGDERPECARLYRRWMTSRSFFPMGGGGH